MGQASDDRSEGEMRSEPDFSGDMNVNVFELDFINRFQVSFHAYTFSTGWISRGYL